MVKPGRDRRNFFRNLAPKRSCFWTTEYLFQRPAESTARSEFENTGVSGTCKKGLIPAPRRVGRSFRSRYDLVLWWS
jgi:hypothetical protein